MAKQLTEKQKRRLQRLSKVIDGGNYAILEHLFEIEEKIDERISEIDGKIPNIKDALDSIKGKDGRTPEKGKDYFDGYTPKKGVDYDDGKDYILTERDRSDIASRIKVPIIEKVVNNNRETVIREIPVVRETIVKEPLTLRFSPQEIRDLLELLRDDERIDAKSIKGIDELIRRVNPPNGPMLHPVALSNLPDVSVVGVSVGQVLTWNGTYWYASNSGGGIVGSQEKSTTTPNGSATTFSFAHAPRIILYNGQVQNFTGDPSFDDITVSGNTITFISTVPITGDKIVNIYQ